jgi:IS5 family transposase
MLYRYLIALNWVDLKGLPTDTKLKANSLISEIYYFMTGAAQVMELAHRRMITGERTFHDEKLFSLFEPHTEMINRGKTPYPWEFGHRVWVSEDKSGFIVDYDIMGAGETGEKWTREIAERIMIAFWDKVLWLSFDRGFYSPLNREWLKEMVPGVCLPKKGRQDIFQKELEGVDGFKESIRKHSGVESAINGLICCGLRRYRDKGEEGYARYVAMGILGRNIHNLGRILLRRDLQELNGREPSYELSKAA